MLRWCCYCQTFIGESEPRNDFSISHGICKHCKEQYKSASKNINQLKPVKNFFKKLHTNITLSTIPDSKAILDESISLGIKPSDLLMGMMQPMLNELGQLYMEGRVTIQQEHLFSEFVSGVLHEMNARYRQSATPRVKVDVLLVCINSNYHSFAVRFLEQLLRGEGISTTAIYPSLPIKDVMVTAEERGARVIGISASMKTQVSELAEIPKLLKQWKKGPMPLIVVGGQALQDGLPATPGVCYHNGDLKDFLRLIQKTLNADLNQSTEKALNA